LTGPRKRTLLPESLLILSLALLVGGTARSSVAAPKNTEAAKRNHSTKTPDKKSHKTDDKQNSGRRGQTKARLTTTKAADTKVTTAKAKPPKATSKETPRKTLAKTTAKQADKKHSTATAKPRVTAEIGKSPKKNTHSSSLRPQAAASISEVSLRAWTDPRQRVLASAKVQDPPTDRAGTVALVQQPAPAVKAALTPAKLASLTPKAAPAAPRTPRRVRSPRGDGLVQVAMARAAVLNGRPANEDLIREALSNRGTPYVWGGASRGGFDCSGFVRYLFLKQRGLELPHSASAQAGYGTPVTRETLQPGDLVFFSTYRPGISHVGVYVGANRFIHAANKRRGVRMDELAGYYVNRYRGARRVTPTPLRFSRKILAELIQDRSVVPPAESEVQ
jgi:cell wall-associated NlpC family hydrolase